MSNKNLSEFTKEELIQMLCHLNECKKFGLVWEDKPEKVAKDCQEKLPILKEVKDKSIELDKNQHTNIIIEGDNYHALSVLNYTHAEKIDVIYIDPPYNTGHKDFIYNDKIVDTEDYYKHSKWLSFIEKRLNLAKNLLSSTGAIFISIDDREFARLKILCDEIFGSNNFVCTLVWTNNEGGGGSDSKYFKVKHEYILCYAKNIVRFTTKNVSIEDLDRYKLSDEYEQIRGKYQLVKLASASIQYSKSLDYPIEMPDSSIITPVENTNKDRACWRWSKQKLQWGIENDFVVYKKDKFGVWQVYTKQYTNCDKDGNIVERTKVPLALIDKYSSTQASNNLIALLNSKKFSYPKPIDLIMWLIDRIDTPNAAVLDFFAGSGTTGQAVLELNKEDGGNRQFILCTNNEKQIAEEVTYPRIKTVITGIRPDGSKYSDGIPANVRYFKTDFVPKNKTNDKLRHDIAPLCTDMIKIKENCFEQIIDNDQLKVFKNPRGLTALIFDDGDLSPHITEIEKLDTDAPVFLYVFSYNNDNRDYEIPLDTRHKYISQPIPEGVLSVYKRIFQPKGN